MNFPLLDPHLKMLASPRTSHQLKLLVIFVSFFFTAYYLFSGRSNVTHQSYKEIYSTAVSGKKAVFVEKFLANEIDGPFDNSTLVALCKTTQWTPGLIFQCESPEGGVGNVRNVVLNCVRYAIEAGATGLVIPEILIQTSQSEQSTPVPFTHFFDTAYFTTTLSSSCPQIHIYGHVNDLYDLPSTAKPIPLTASTLTKSFIAESVLAAPGNWSSSFRNFLNESHPTPFSTTKPILIKLSNALLEFPLSYDTPAFIASFGRILRFREDTRRIAATILYALSTKYNFDLSPTVQNGKFYGAHLRTGADATAAGWTPYEIQSANYLFSADHLKLPLIYLVSGSPDDIYAFSEKAANMSISVTHKELLLGGEQGKGAKGFEREFMDLKTLSWDQRLLVDYEVLLRSSAFGGTWESSLSWNIAMRRHIVNGNGKWLGLERPNEALSTPAIPAAPTATAQPKGPNLTKLPTGSDRVKSPNIVKPPVPSAATEALEAETTVASVANMATPAVSSARPKRPRPSAKPAPTNIKSAVDAESTAPTKVVPEKQTGKPKGPNIVKPAIPGKASGKPKGPNIVKPVIPAKIPAIVEVEAAAPDAETPDWSEGGDAVVAPDSSTTRFDVKPDSSSEEYSVTPLDSSTEEFEVGADSSSKEYSVSPKTSSTKKYKVATDSSTEEYSADSSTEEYTVTPEGEKVKKRQVAPKVAPTFSSKVGDTSFRDGLSIIYGPVGEGRRIMLSMWP